MLEVMIKDYDEKEKEIFKEIKSHIESGLSTTDRVENQVLKIAREAVTQEDGD